MSECYHSRTKGFNISISGHSLSLGSRQIPEPVPENLEAL